MVINIAKDKETTMFKQSSSSVERNVLKISVLF